MTDARALLRAVLRPGEPGHRHRRRRSRRRRSSRSSTSTSGASRRGRKPEPLRTVEPAQIAETVLTLRDPAQPLYLEGYHKPAADRSRRAGLRRAGRRADARPHVAALSPARARQEARGRGAGRQRPSRRQVPEPLAGASPCRRAASSNDAVRDAMRPELERLKNEDVTDEELARFKTRAKADLIRSLNSNEGLAEQLADYHTLFGDWRELFRYVDRMDAVTKADIRRVAAATFKESNRTVGRIETAAPAEAVANTRRLGASASRSECLPCRRSRTLVFSPSPPLARRLRCGRRAASRPGRRSRPSSSTRSCRPSQVPKPVRFVLPNGMVVMVIEDHELPLVNVIARIRTGSLLEPAAKTGLAVAGRRRCCAPAARPASSPTSSTSSSRARAASIETGIGADSGSASMSALKADVPAVMKVFADVLRHPAFDPDRLKIARRPPSPRRSRARTTARNAILSREFAKVIYGDDSPFARTDDLRVDRRDHARRSASRGTRSTTTPTASSSASSATSPSTRRGSW